MEIKQKPKAQPLEVGEKYLAISVLGQIKLIAFPNKSKTRTNEPDFTGNGVSVWVNHKKAKQVEEVFPVVKV